jgi:hypothetical protein
MGHHHNHNEHKAAPTETTISFEEKAAKLIAHWIHHNEDHGQGYARWAKDFQEHGYSEAAKLIQGTVELSQQITRALTQAARLIPGHHEIDD